MKAGEIKNYESRRRGNNDEGGVKEAGEGGEIRKKRERERRWEKEVKRRGRWRKKKRAGKKLLGMKKC